MIHHHFSSSALSENQLQKLLKRIQQFNKNILDIQTQYVHFSSFIDTPSNESLTLLDSLLTYGEYKKHPKHSDYKFIVIPRFGTLSPWASKATDIAKKCNLDVNKIERGIVFHLTPLSNCSISKEQLEQISSLCMDRMTETVVYNLNDAEKLFTENSPKSLNEIDILQKGRDELVNYNQKNGLALSEEEIQYLTDYFFKIKKNPTDAELMMFAQANSEHCRHKIF
ncbi:MAG: phosphoribosylformylglycinamidine synthase, partial [Candidatus Pelagibacter sp.]